MKPQKYKIRLTEKERTELEKKVNEGIYTKKQITRAEILLEQDNFYYFNSRYRPQEIVAARCDVSTTTVYKVSKQYLEEGLNAAIIRKKREKPPVASILTAESEGRIVTLANSDPPEGYKRWTLRLLEKKINESGIVGHISYTTIGRILRKHQMDHV